MLERILEKLNDANSVLADYGIVSLHDKLLHVAGFIAVGNLLYHHFKPEKSQNPKTSAYVLCSIMIFLTEFWDYNRYNGLGSSVIDTSADVVSAAIGSVIGVHYAAEKDKNLGAWIKQRAQNLYERIRKE